MCAHMDILFTLIAIPVGFAAGCWLGLKYWHADKQRFQNDKSYKGSKMRPVNEREGFPL